MILHDRDWTVYPCCDNMVIWFPVTFGQPPFLSSVLSISTKMVEAHQRDVRNDMITVCNFCLKKKIILLTVKREMPTLFFVNYDKAVLFSMKRDRDPPLPPLKTKNKNNKNQVSVQIIIIAHSLHIFF